MRIIDFAAVARTFLELVAAKWLATSSAVAEFVEELLNSDPSSWINFKARTDFGEIALTTIFDRNSEAIAKFSY